MVHCCSKLKQLFAWDIPKRQPVLCKWNNDFVRKISGTKIKDIKFYRNSTELKKNPPAKIFMPETAPQQKCLLGMLNQILDRSKLVGLSLFADYSESFHYRAQTIPKRVLQPKIIRGTNRESSKISTRIKTSPRTD